MKKVIIGIVFLFTMCLHSQNADIIYPEPEFENFSLGMPEATARVKAGNAAEIPANSLGMSGIFYMKNNLKYSLWFYKGKLQGINVTGKYNDAAKKELVEKYNIQYGAGGYTFEFGLDHYYWYFYRGAVHYTIEIKHFLIDIHYSVSDSGYGRSE